MSGTTLCNTCQEHFRFSRTDLVENIRQFKREALESAVHNDHSNAEVERLQHDLERYEKAISHQPEGAMPCPWHLDQPAQDSVPTAQVLTVWDRDKHSRRWIQLRESVGSTGCQLCDCLVNMIQHVHRDSVPDSACLTSTWFLTKGSLLPSMLRFDIFSDALHQTPPTMLVFHPDVAACRNCKSILFSMSKLPYECLADQNAKGQWISYPTIRQDTLQVTKAA